MQNHRVSIVSDQPEADQCIELSNKLRAPVTASVHEVITPVILQINCGKLSLGLADPAGFNPISLDFNRIRYRPDSDPLLRAMGKKAHTVIDATAGWCADALQIARSGRSILAIERDRLVMTMVQDAWSRMDPNGIQRNLTLLEGDSIEVLQSLESKVDVVYLDPMFSSKPKSSRPKKPLQVLQKIVDHSVDEQHLLHLALKKATQRVVVKRPLHANAIQSGKVGEIRTKSIRFDLYKPQCS